MSINEHPQIGTLLTCNFDAGFKEPEMVKLRLVVVVAPKIAARKGLCTVVPLSLTEPNKIMPYHYRIDNFNPPLPDNWGNQPRWFKGDMIITVAFHRLDFIRVGKTRNGDRIYRYDTFSDEEIRTFQKCMLSSLGLISLTKHLV